MHGFGSLDRSSHGQQEIDLSTIYTVEPVTLVEQSLATTRFRIELRR